MTDEEFENLALSKVIRYSPITEENFASDIKNVVQIDLSSEENKKVYLKVAKELARRLSKRGLTDNETISSEKLTPIEKKAAKMIRNDSSLDRDHLKGDYVISNFLESERIKRNQSIPPQKRLQANDDELYQLFKLKIQKKSIRGIAETLNIHRTTIYKILNKDYVDTRDIDRIVAAEKKAMRSERFENKFN
ncbi:hypothetical protein EGCR1_15930 (plasmid) [Enterococcus gilvus]|jgi:hypothetical protein|uniref:hypothetical protein n=1 Tax=Enterococcus gilvus TaxID=160453 RepID=UPI000DF5EE00|nr:hypothetical protein [Enterococcus gilvus]AXG40209.1 hypothetical protein EGCR1_15930 [Enterococcus gilvus]